MKGTCDIMAESKSCCSVPRGKSERAHTRRIANICALPLLLFLAEYLALAGLDLLAQLSDRIHHFTALNSVHLKKFG